MLLRFVQAINRGGGEALEWSTAVDYILLPFLFLGFLASLRMFIIARRNAGTTYTLTDGAEGVVLTVSGPRGEQCFVTSELEAIQQPAGQKPPNKRWRLVFSNGRCDLSGEAGDRVAAASRRARPDVMVMPYNDFTGEVIV